MKQLLTLVFILMLQPFVIGQSYNIRDFGAKGDGKTNDTKAIQKTIDKCAETGGTVYFPDGEFVTGTIILKSNITIHLTTKAVWRGSTDTSLYNLGILPKKISSYYPHRVLITAINEQNITITGFGTINGSGYADIFQTKIGEDPNRPFGLHIIGCKNLVFENFLLTHTGFWGLRVDQCNDLKIKGVRVFNHSNLNNDGIDIVDCHDVIVSDCKIDASDDALCFKSEAMKGVKNVVVTNCLLSSHASAFKFGTASVGGFQNFTVSNCIIKRSQAKEMHHVEKLWEGITGIDLLNVDGGITCNILFNNILIDGSHTPVFIKIGNRHRRRSKPADDISENIFFNNIIIRNGGDLSSSVTGYPGHPVRNIQFNNVRFQYLGGAGIKDTTLDIPENSSSYPYPMMFNSNLPSYGLYLRHVDNIQLNNVQFELVNNDPRAAIVMDDVKNTELYRVTAEKHGGVVPLIRMRNTTNAVINVKSNVLKLKDYIRIEDMVSENICVENYQFQKLNSIQAPENLKAKAQVPNRSIIRLLWDAVEGIETGYVRYNIYRNGKKIAQTSTNSFTDTDVTENEEYIYTVGATNLNGRFEHKKSVQVKALKDKVAVSLDSIEIINNQTIILKFSEPVSEGSAKDVSNFQISDNISIKKLQISKCGQLLTLSTSPFQQKKNYILQIKGLKDRSQAGNPVKIKQEFKDTPTIAHWNFESIENGTLQDVSGNENHGKIYQVKLIEGIAGKAGYFNRQAFVDCSNPNRLNITGDMAISVWVKIKKPNIVNKDHSAYYRVLSKRNAWNVPDGYELEINPEIGSLNLSGGAQGADGQGRIAFQTDEEWHHIAMVMKNGEVILFVDGRFIGKDKNADLPAPNSTTLIIGATPRKTNFFYGAIDELMIFNRALSEQEIKLLSKKVRN